MATTRGGARASGGLTMMRFPEDPSSYHVAVVEDDDELREQILLPVLRGAGFAATGHSSALAFYRELFACDYDLVIVDVGLPDDDGFAVVRHLRRAAPTLGIVILSGYALAADRARGMAAGADAYLVKPADPAKLLATLGRLARRASMAPAPTEPDPNSGPPAGGLGSGWRLDPSGWRLLAPNGAAVRLNLPERQVVLALATASGGVVPREVLIALLADDTHGFDPHRLEMLIYRLRQKCMHAGGEPLPLNTVRGAGYLLAL
jgi:DNA-binding response OmpR family regulator